MFLGMDLYIFVEYKLDVEDNQYLLHIPVYMSVETQHILLGRSIHRVH
jgi:hypothetical protein